MRAFPAGLLLLAFALICAVQMMKAAHGDDSVRRIMTHRSLLRTMMRKGAYGEGAEAETGSRKVNARIALETTTTGSTTDPACAALACQPGSKCVVDQNGVRYCQW
ncbi:unnamed protein product, partial [Closterium sp. Naga37s-1]